MLLDAVAALRCPVCREALQLQDEGQQGLACHNGHVFDAAKQGYFNLLTGKGTAFEADSSDMVAARHRFLEAGHYRPLAEKVAQSLAGSLKGPDARVLDAGTGTGYYLHAVLQESSASAIGLDISKFALRRAARKNPQAANLVWDIWRDLPLADNTVDAIVVIFAPRNPPEFARVLRPGGKLKVVTPLPGHLAEIAQRAGMLSIEEGKEERLAESMRGHFTPVGGSNLEIPLKLSGHDARDLAFMGPAGHHLLPEDLDGLAESSGTVTATARFRLSEFILS